MNYNSFEDMEAVKKNIRPGDKKIEGIMLVLYRAIVYFISWHGWVHGGVVGYFELSHKMHSINIIK